MSAKKRFDPTDDFDIAFHQPTWWWMPMDIWIDDQRFNFKASGVMNDPMQELISAACNMINGREPASVVNLWREPEWHSLVFEPSANSKKVCVSLLLNQNAEISKPESKISVYTSTSAVCRKIAGAFRSLLDDVGLPSYETRSGWGKPFPISEIETLNQLLESAK